MNRRWIAALILAALAAGLGSWWAFPSRPSVSPGAATSPALPADQAAASSPVPQPEAPSPAPEAGAAPSDGSIPTSLRTDVFLQAQTKALGEERRRQHEIKRAAWNEKKAKRRAAKLEKLRVTNPERAAKLEARWAAEEKWLADKKIRDEQIRQRNAELLRDPNFQPPPRSVTRPGMGPPIQFEEGQTPPDRLDPQLYQAPPAENPEAPKTAPPPGKPNP